jgi:hypothetical protein
MAFGHQMLIEALDRFEGFKTVSFDSKGHR